MEFSEWEPVYGEICSDLGIDPSTDEPASRLLEAVTMFLDLDDEDCIIPLIGDTVTVFGAAQCLEQDIQRHPPEGTLIAAGSACGRMMEAGFAPHILVTDLDGDIEPQIRASADGAVTLILAHGDNTDLVRTYAPMFKGKVVLTTQNRPRGNVLCFGGFTDGDRQVCLARHFGASRIVLLGFDYDEPYPKEGSDPEMKRRKLTWARRIIGDSPDIVMP